jgi:hypothetical protein
MSKLWSVWLPYAIQTAAKIMSGRIQTIIVLLLLVGTVVVVDELSGR